jgi:hypothetical protein
MWRIIDALRLAPAGAWLAFEDLLHESGTSRQALNKSVQRLKEREIVRTDIPPRARRLFITRGRLFDTAKRER